MINDVAKQVIENFNSEVFVETGFFRGSTAVVVRSWFKDLMILEVEINPVYCGYGNNMFRNDKNTRIVNADSKTFLAENINTFEQFNSPVFYLDAHWDPANWPLRHEIQNICKLKNPIIIIDDFKTPNPDGTTSDKHGYDSYLDQDCDKDYILDLIEPHTDCIFYAKEPTIDGQGCGIIFINRNYEEIVKLIDEDNFISEKL
tara:strand:- start:380 stop:985 length:606 start_codon:yes stop_codon:yes gene_type:complete